MDLAIEAADNTVTTSGAITSNPHQVVRSHAGGVKNGPARAEALNQVPEQEIAKKTVDERWKKRGMDR